jgi:hypothetical protein
MRKPSENPLRLAVATSRLSATTYRMAIPRVLWKVMWQWKSQVPGLSGTMSAVTISIGIRAMTSIRM